MEDPQSQTLLCQQIDTCPDVTVDPSALPECGFRLHAGGAIDLECVCGSELCSMGAAATCADAKQLLDRQTSLLVCQQASDGRCVPLALVAPDGGSGSGGSPCTACAAQCGGSPACFQACGC
jgi:hypothetical protein